MQFLVEAIKKATARIGQELSRHCSASTIETLIGPQTIREKDDEANQASSTRR